MKAMRRPWKPWNPVAGSAKRATSPGVMMATMPPPSGASPMRKGDRTVRSWASGVIAAGIPDGLKCEARGNIWVTGPGGVWIFSSDGEHLGKVLVPQNVGNLTWGDSDWKTLYMPSSESLYTIRTKVAARREPYMG